MIIDITKVYGDLMYVASYTRELEFSGNLFAEVTPECITVYDFVLLDVGSYGYTEIDPMLMVPLITRPDAKKMKGWVHKHPVGNGVPGPHNWSGTDERNIKETPLGSFPDFVKWSFSIVLTPRGWVGRVDNYVTGKTLHCDVVYFREDIAAKAELLTPKQAPKAIEVTSELDEEEELIGYEDEVEKALRDQLSAFTVEDLVETQYMSDKEISKKFDVHPFSLEYAILCDILDEMGYPSIGPDDPDDFVDRFHVETEDIYD